MEEGKRGRLRVSKGSLIAIAASVLFAVVMVSFNMVIVAYVVGCLAISAFFAIVALDIGVPKYSTARLEAVESEPSALELEEPERIAS